VLPKIGMMEGWNNGMMENRKMKCFERLGNWHDGIKGRKFLCGLNPIFQNSIIPLFQFNFWVY